MEASAAPPTPSLPNNRLKPNLEATTQKLLSHGIKPTPKIIHTLRKKERQKSERRHAKETSKQPPPLTDTQIQAISEENHFQLIKSEYKKFTKSMKFEENQKMVGVPWEGLERLRLRELASHNMEYDGEKLKPERLTELSDVIECERDRFSWLLDDDVEFEDGWFEKNGGGWAPRKRSEAESIKFLITRLSETELRMKDWKFSRMMRQTGLQFTEDQVLKILEGLGDRGLWRHALSVVEWLYNFKDSRQYKSRFVYTKLLAVLGRARKPSEALRVFNLMQGDAFIYPDMAAYHSLAVTLGQAGFLKELVNVIESMKEKPKKIRNVRHRSWDPLIQPDIVIFNAVLNACVSTRQWKGVSWVFEQLRKNGLKPNGASYGLAMEVMMQSEKYDLVQEFFAKMKRSGEALNALTYKVLVKAFWKEGKVDEAVQAVREMERRGIIGKASVYYELARSLCYHGRWQEAFLEIEKLRMLRPTRPLAIAFSGIILSAMNGGHVQDCVSIFEHCKTILAPDIGMVNAMLKVFGRNDMFHEAKELFEETMKNTVVSDTSIDGHITLPKPDAYTFISMLKASASAHQWEYFDHVYKELTLSGEQLDFTKYSTELLEASHAGKWHLLEHAFDTILEAGEIPPESFFSEMVCQATNRRDYERAVRIINAMAYAPFQISFEQWINLFEKNEDRIGHANLDELQKTLVSRNLVQEASVLNLSRALQYICSSCEEDSMINKSTPRSCHEESDNHESTNVLYSCNKLAGPDSGDQDYNRQDVSNCKTRCHKTSINNEDQETGENAGIASFDERVFAFDLELDVSESDSDDQEYKHVENAGVLSDVNSFNFELIIPMSEDDSQELEMPSAYEILESWKEKGKG